MSNTDHHIIGKIEQLTRVPENVTAAGRKPSLTINEMRQREKHRRDSININMMRQLISDYPAKARLYLHEIGELR